MSRTTGLAADLERRRMEVVGRLTRGITHEMNNVLATLQGNVELAERVSAGNDPRLARYIATLRSSIERATKLMQQLMSVSRRRMGGPATRLDLARGLADLTGLLDRATSASIKIETDLQPGLPPVEVDQGWLELTILSLALDARAAIPKSGVIRIGGRTPGAGHVAISVSGEAGHTPDVAVIAEARVFAEASGGSASADGPTVTLLLPAAGS